MSASLKQLFPHIFVFFGFIVISLAYFYPVLQGKEIYQSDIAQYIGMAREQNEFREETGEEPYWTDAAFGGMPTYQLGANYPHNYIKELDRLIRFLPRPADYLFLYFIGLYILLLVLKIDYRLAFLGALAFGFSTYLIIILGVGHNAKAHAIAYMPWVLGGILLCFRRHYIIGFLLLAFGMALEINANHFQMTFYLLLLVIILGLVYLRDAVRKKQLSDFFKALGVMVVAVIIAIGTNAAGLLATQEYTEFSTRGESDITISPEGAPAPESGLSYDYITQYSYGILETFNLFIPRFMGGSSGEELDKDSNIYAELLKIGASPAPAIQFVQSAPTYWGNQPYVGAPAYIGATVIFLFVFALFLVRGRLKWWIVGGSILALVLSWGKNFGFLTEFFINFVPLYNKFRAVSSIQVIIELCVPILAAVGLSKLFSSEVNKDEKFHGLKWSTIIVGGLALSFLLLKSLLFSFSGPNDDAMVQQLGMDFIAALQEDREAMFTADTFRSLILVLLSAILIWTYLKNKVNKNLTIVLFSVLILFDLIGVDKRYVNNDDFVSSQTIDEPFKPNAADLQILQDTTHYRVLDLSVNPFNTARTSFFHNSIGGYHAAKPGRMQDLFDFYISQNHMEVLNMLNTKYIIVPSEEGIQAKQNPQANGNAWFVENIEFVETANAAILALADINTKETTVVQDELEDELQNLDVSGTANANIKLTSYQPNELIYEYTADQERLAVFSEIYYSDGWKAYIDGEKVSHFRANYVLRAMVVPEGDHTISFKFEPEVVKTGSSIALVSCILLGLLLISGLYYRFRKR